MVNPFNMIRQRWQALRIPSKFSLTFGLLLALIALIAVTDYLVLITTRHRTETTIMTSTKIQRLVFGMRDGVEVARRLGKDFFLRYPASGGLEDRQKYVWQVDNQFAEVEALSNALRRIVAASDISENLQNSDVKLNLHTLAVNRYATSFAEAVALVEKLAADDTGLLPQLERYSASLQTLLQTDGDWEKVALYYKMQSFEKKYLLTRQRPFMQSAFNVAALLRHTINDTPYVQAEHKEQALTQLDNYLAVARDILPLDVAIRSKSSQLDLLAEAIEPISIELIALARAEFERARSQITRASRTATAVLVVTALIGIVLAAMLARVLNHSIIHNVLSLTNAAAELQAGNLEVRARVNSRDEFGRLAGSFNSMAARLNSLVGNLEQEVAERTAALQESNEQLQKEIVDRKQAEEALKASEQNLHDLIYIASHDLQTPIVSMVGYATNILRKHTQTLDEKGVYAVQRIKANAERLHLLVLSLLDISRLNTVKNPYRLCRPEEIVRRIVGDLELTIKESGAEIVIEDLPTIFGDEPRLTTVFRNLLSNALNYGGTHILVGHENGTYFVRDNGIGIAPRNLGKIFKACERLKKIEVEGVGMGLTFCQKVIAQHKGKIWAESEGEGKGASFYFTLSSIS